MAQTQEEIAQEKRSWHWRNSMRPARFFALDARAAIPFCILLFHISWGTFILTLVITGFFRHLERKGMTFPSALRAMRSWFVGQARPAWLSVRRRRMLDYG
ncbi:MAG: type IV secretion protein IcmT [Rhodospirillales bacterium]|nr:type IV secretion protein IcmT [Rhodospirillales bacterium]